MRAEPVLEYRTREQQTPSIDIQDHLSHYDTNVSKKMYLTFSEGTWRYLFENRVQYINRLERCEWLEMFKSVGCELVEEDSWKVSIDHLKLAQRYAHMERRDLECGVLRVLLRKLVCNKQSGN